MRILFVCSGNLCRSPMAEVYMRHRLATDGRHGVHRIESAGTLGLEGDGADGLAILTAERDAGADLRPHRAQGLRRETVEDADLILVMEQRHRRHLMTFFPGHVGKIRLLSEYAPRGSGLTRGADIEDPIGRDADSFRACFAAIRSCVDSLLEHIEP